MRTPAPVQSVPMSDAHRLHRIAELLCKAILLTEATRAVRPVAPQAEPVQTVALPGFAEDNLLSEEERVLNYLDFVDAASPATIRNALGFSRTGTYRILRQLTAAGCVAASGQTRELVYRLNRGEPPVEKISLN